MALPETIRVLLCDDHVVVREGQLQLIWSSTTIGGAAAVQRWAESFNRYYGLNLDVVFTPGPAMAETVTKVIQEHQSGRRASTGRAESLS